MDNNPYNNNANTNVYFLNAKINGPETVINSYSTLPQSSSGNQIPVFLAASSSTGGQYAATLPQQANVSRQQTHEVLTEHKTHCACTDLPNTQNSSGEVPVELNSANYFGPYATLPQPIQNFAGIIPVLLNVHHRQRQPFQTGSDPSSMMSMVDPNGVGGWYPAVNVVRTRVKESELQNMLNWPIVPVTEEVLDAIPPPIPGNESTQRKSGIEKKNPVEKEDEDEEEEETEDNAEKGSCLLNGLAVTSCVFAMFMIVLGVANLTVYIVYKVTKDVSCISLFYLFLSTPSTSTEVLETGIGIFAVLIFISGILIIRVEDPTKVSAFTEKLTCTTTVGISPFISLFGLVEFILTIIIHVLLMKKRGEILQERASKARKKKPVKRAKRDVLGAAKMEGQMDSDTDKKKRKKNEEEESEGEDDDEDDEEEEDEEEVAENNNRGSDEGSESTEETERNKPMPKQTKKSKMKDDSKNAQMKHLSTSPASSLHHPVPRPEILCVPLGSIYAGYAANPYNQATMDNGYMWGRYLPFQYNGRVAFSPTQ